MNVGEKLPVFQLLDVTGKPVALESFSGKVVLIHLWKCKWNQCRAEIPHLLEIKKQYPADKIEILSINVIDKEGQTKAEVDKYGMNYTVLAGRGEQLTSKYKIAKLPHLFILDQKGIIQSSQRFLKAEEIKRVIDRILKVEK